MPDASKTETGGIDRRSPTATNPQVGALPAAEKFLGTRTGRRPGEDAGRCVEPCRYFLPGDLVSPESDDSAAMNAS